MNTVNNSDTASINDSVPGNAAKDEAARAAQMDTARHEPTSARTDMFREEPPSAGERPPRREPPRDDIRDSTASSHDPARAVIAMGSDNPSDKPKTDREQLVPLFAQDLATDYRARWVVVQQGFVDDPRQAVHQGDELVTQVMTNLTETFSKERAALEGKLGESDEASTEVLRVALRRYRSFFERLLSF